LPEKKNEAAQRQWLAQQSSRTMMARHNIGGITKKVMRVGLSKDNDNFSVGDY
jgi:hypothetical protein